MQTTENESVENKFLLLSVEEKASIISHGVALRFAEWKKRLFLAESKPIRRLQYVTKTK